MARKKVPVELNPSTEVISEGQVYDVLEFARQAYNIYPNIYTPDNVNARMKDVTMNPLAQTEDEITNALKNPKNNELKLRGISEFFEYTNMLYKRQMAYLGNLLSFDWTYTCVNAKDKSDYTSTAYKKDVQVLKDFFDKFDCKREFKKVTNQMMRQDAYFCFLRNEGEQFVLQEMPIDYCKITGNSDYGYLYDFNMLWFISNPGVSIDMYPSVFKKYYKQIILKSGGKGLQYNPGLSPEMRDGNWVYWVQTSPEDNAWAFKFNMEQAGQLPFFAPMFADIVQMPLIRNLQKNKYMIEASRLIFAKVPMLKEPKSGNVKDMFAVDPATLGNFVSLVKAGLNSAINFGMMPTDEVKEFNFKGTENNIFNDYNSNLASLSGINSKLVYTGSEKSNAIESQASINVDESIMTRLYPYFANFVNYFVNKQTKKYKFKIAFEGTELDINRDSRLEKALTLADKGIVLPQKIAAAYGMSPTDMDRMLEEANAFEWPDKLMMMLNPFTQGADAATGGRPKSKTKDLGDAGMETRERGSNIAKGGDI